MIDARRLHMALADAQRRMDEACLRVGRAPGSAQIVLAGKYVGADEAPALVEAGVAVIGENRLQDLVAKQDVLGSGAIFDFIGQLQSRKVKDVLPRVRLIHSVDRVSLLDEIARRAVDPGSVRSRALSGMTE